MQIPVYVFTGFIKSGKTKFIQETFEDERFNDGTRTLLLVCEKGREQYDSSTYPHACVYLEQIEQEITKVETAIHLIEERAKEQNTDVKNDSTRVSLLRTKIVKQADLGSAQDELSKLMCVAENAKDALIRIYKDVYPGVTVYINDQKKMITEQQRQVEFEVSSGKLRMYQIEDD